MENESDESEKPCETVTLVLKTKRFEVEKQKLISKSQYFAALLSANYLEYHQKEHIINYDISPISLQDFIDWIHNDKLDTSAINDFQEFDRLLTLLELSVLFAADNLVKDITDRLERHMSPKYALNIWLLAQELNINILRDLSLDVCLDRFNQVPPSLVYELSRENFLKLIGNNNIMATESYLLDITHEWMNRHHDFTISLDIIKNKKANILESIISCEGLDIVNSENYIHCWDGNDFFELTSFNYPKDITDRSTGKKTLVGMQIIGRRYDLYLCGGEFGIGSSKFNKNVWRYSLISKKWYLQTVMPVERRHMIAVILKNKLLLVGGVGRYRQKLRSVDIYDIYTDTWTSGEEIPWDFSSVPEHSILDEKLFIYECTHVFTYFLDKDIWKQDELEKEMLRKSGVPKMLLAFKMFDMSCYIDVVNPDKMILRIFTTCSEEYCDCLNNLVTNHISLSPLALKFYREYTHYCILKVDNLCKRPTLLVCMDSESESKSLHFRNIPIQNPNNFRSFLSSHSPRKFFHLIHPAHLHMMNLNNA